MTEAKTPDSVATITYGDNEFVLLGNAKDYPYSHILSSGRFYEEDLLSFISGLSLNAGCIVDAGAHIGNHTVFFAGVLGRKVISAEPVPRTVELLNMNVKANSLEGLVEVHPVALWNKSSDLEILSGLSGNSGTYHVRAGRDAQGESAVQGRRLDDLVADAPVAMIKIDVEGAELQVLEGSKSIIERDRPVLVVEMTGPVEHVQLVGYLEDLGYEPIHIGGNTDTYVWLPGKADGRLARRASLEGLRQVYRQGREAVGLMKGLREAVQQLRRDTIAVDNHDPESVEKLLSRVDALFQEVNLGRAASEARIDRIQGSSEAARALVERVLDVTDRSASSLIVLEKEIDRLLQLSATRNGDSQKQQEALQGLQKQVERVTDSVRDNSAAVDAMGRVVEKVGTEAEVAARSRWEDVLAQINSIADVLRERFDEADALEALQADVREHGTRMDWLIDAVSKLSDNLAVTQEQSHRELREAASGLLEQDADLQRLAATQSATMDTQHQEMAQLVEERSAALEGALGSKSQEDAGRYADIEKRLGAIEQAVASVSSPGAPERGTVDRLARAFEALSHHVGELQDSAWSHEVAHHVLQDLIGGVPGAAEPLFGGAGRVRRLDASVSAHEKVRIGIASMPGRERPLARVLEILSPQADEIFVYLNGMNEVPPALPRFDNVVFLTGPDLGDRGKFVSLAGFDGYFLSCDDDIEYPSFYVNTLLSGIEKYGRRAVVGLHGSVFSDDFKDYYDKQSRRVYAFYSDRPQDTPVHLLGTGVLGFHTSTLRVDLDRFIHPNMADVWFAIQANEQDVPRIILEHAKGWAIPIDTEDESISRRSILDKESSGLNMKKLVTSVVQSVPDWKITEARVAVKRADLSVAIIGRTDRARWKKGGILESCNRIHELLTGYGVDSRMFDIETGDAAGLGGFRPDVIMVYVGDPERPDYAEVERIVERHASNGSALVMNMSITGRSSRNRYIERKMKHWEQKFPGQFSLMTFTEGARFYPEFADIQDMILEIPKTIRIPSPPRANFHETSGVFVGDIAKLSDSGIIDGDGHEWIAGIREALPEAKLYGVQQYKPRFAADFDIDVVWPFMRDEFSEKLSRMRLMVAPAKYLTFEMVPMEIMSLGVPVVYRDMPQSLSETIGLSGVRVEDPSQLRHVLPMLYRDPVVWRDFSRGGQLRVEAQGVRHVGGHIYLRFKQAKDRMIAARQRR